MTHTPTFAQAPLGVSLALNLLLFSVVQFPVSSFYPFSGWQPHAHFPYNLLHCFTHIILLNWYIFLCYIYYMILYYPIDSSFGNTSQEN